MSNIDPPPEGKRVEDEPTQVVGESRPSGRAVASDGFANTILPEWVHPLIHTLNYLRGVEGEEPPTPDEIVSNVLSELGVTEASPERLLSVWGAVNGLGKAVAALRDGLGAILEEKVDGKSFRRGDSYYYFGRGSASWKPIDVRELERWAGDRFLDLVAIDYVKVRNLKALATQRGMDPKVAQDTFVHRKPSGPHRLRVMRTEDATNPWEAPEL